MVFGKRLSNGVLVTKFTPVNYYASVLFDEVRVGSRVLKRVFGYSPAFGFIWLLDDGKDYYAVSQHGKLFKFDSEFIPTDFKEYTEAFKTVIQASRTFDEFVKELNGKVICHGDFCWEVYIYDDEVVLSGHEFGGGDIPIYGRVEEVAEAYKEVIKKVRDVWIRARNRIILNFEVEIIPDTYE